LRCRCGGRPANNPGGRGFFCPRVRATCVVPARKGEILGFAGLVGAGRVRRGCRNSVPHPRSRETPCISSAARSFYPGPDGHDHHLLAGATCTSATSFSGRGAQAHLLAVLNPMVYCPGRRRRGRWQAWDVWASVVSSGARTILRISCAAGRVLLL
jgi:hypothetical protein